MTRDEILKKYPANTGFIDLMVYQLVGLATVINGTTIVRSAK